MTSTTDVPRKGDRVRVSWKDGGIDRTAEFVADEYREAARVGGAYPEIVYKSPLGRGFFVIGPDYSFEILERAEPEPVRFAKGDRVRFLEDYCGTPAGSKATVVVHKDAYLEPSGLAQVKIDGGGITTPFGRRLELIPQPELIDVVPGMVLTGSIGRFRFIILPDGYYDVANGVVNSRDGETWDADYYTVIFDPRNAEALPSPFGIKPGDQVKRVSEADGVTETVEFEVNHVDVTGMIGARYGTYYSPVGFEVQNREVLDRLPAGTITRFRYSGRIHLRTAEGWIDLEDGYVSQAIPDALESEIRAGHREVIYLP